jgi:hypothetical protein
MGKLLETFTLAPSLTAFYLTPKEMQRLIGGEDYN